MFLRGFCAALEFTYARKGRGLFFSARVFLGVGFANISMSFALKRARFDASPPLFIAVIIFSRTDLALAIAPSRIHDGRLTDSVNRCLLRYCAVGVEVAITPALDGEVVAKFGFPSSS